MTGMALVWEVVKRQSRPADVVVAHGLALLALGLGITFVGARNYAHSP
jgi:hypothetical protein